MKTKRFYLLWVVLFATMLLAACGAPAAAPTATPIPPTLVPPTDTAIPPTATPVPPTATPVPPTATAIPEETVTEDSEILSGFVDNDGVKIHYEVVGEGPPLVLIHGGSGSTQDWELFGYRDALKGDYRLIMIDLRGHGQSDKPHDAAAYAPETQVGDIVAVLDELGIDKTHYFGFSLGGALGWALAKHVPERFHSMIIDGDEPAGYDDSELTAMMVEMGATDWAHMVEDVAHANEIRQPGIYEAYAENDVEALALAFEELSWMDATDILTDINIPMLLIQGTNDAELEAMTEASEELPNARLVLLEGLDHIQGFFLSDQVLPHITAFLKEVGAEAETPAAELHSDIDYAEAGPYAVGVRNFEIEPGGDEDRLLTTTVWYPALNLDGLPDKYMYKMGFEGGEFPSFLVLGKAVEDAPPATDDGPFPVVVYAHGFSGFRQEAHYLAEQLASQGFVVIAADHRDNLGVWPEPKHAEDEFRRQSEVIRLLDFAEELGVTDEILANMVDSESVAAMGSSYGGQTSLVAGGARLDLEHLQQWCTDNTVGGESPDPDCEYVLGEQQELASLAGLDEIPAGLWPDWSDPRIDAVVSLAPWVGALGQRGLENVEVPTMLMIGSGDEDVGNMYETIDPYNAVASEQKAEVVLDGAAHMIFWPDCDAAPQLKEWELEQLCNDPVWGNAQAHELIKYFTTAFLLAELKWDNGAAAALAPDAVDFESIEYQAEGFDEGSTSAAGLDAAMMVEIEGLIDQTMVDNELPGLAIGIVKDGEVVYAEGFGVANVEEDKPVTSQSLFNMAQVSMMFTSAAIMQLVEQGVIDLDAPVTEYLPYFRLDDPRFTEITVHQLLDNTSGLPNTSVEKDVSWKNRDYDNPDNEEGALERFVRSLDDLALLAEPGGNTMLYSSLGYDVLGDIVAKVSGQSYEAYMQENILDPLGMDHSTYMLDEADAELLTAGHRSQIASPEVEVWEFFPFNMQHSPGNGLIANVDDMNSWALALLNGGELDGVRILESESLDEIWSAQSTMDWGGLFQDYGMGWMLAEDEGHRFVWHVGGNPGFISNLILAPDDDIAVVTMVNSFREIDDDEPWYATDLGTRIMYLLLGLDYNAYYQD